MNKKILIAGLLASVIMFAPINSAYGNNSLSLKNNEDNLLYNTMSDDKWVKTYDKDDLDFGYVVKQTLDGGYIVVALNDWIFKTDNNGNILWEKSYSNSDYHIAVSVTVTNDNKYVITGGNFDNHNVCLLKLDTDGTQIWNKTFAIDGDGLIVVQTSDGGYAIVGSDYYNILLLKTDSNGSLSWVKSYDCDGWNERGESLIQTPDGGYIILGFSNADTFNTRLLKTDENGTFLWDKKYCGKGFVGGNSMDIAEDGGYIITGTTRKGPDDILDNDIWLLKTDEDGTLLWEKTFGTPNHKDGGFSVIATDDGGYIIAGFIYVSFRDFDAILIKTDNLGNVEWSKTYGGDFHDDAFSVQQTTDGGYILTGTYHRPPFGFYSDVFLIKTDENGNAPPLSKNIKSKGTIFRNKVFDTSFLTLLLEKFPILEKLFSIIS